MTDKFGIEMFQSRDIMQFAVRNLENGFSDIVKLCLKKSLNIGEYNIIEIFNMACRHNRIELIEWLLVHYDHVTCTCIGHYGLKIKQPMVKLF
jgi:hypothetical protein